MTTVNLFGAEWRETPEEEILERAENALAAFAERAARDRDVREFEREHALRSIERRACLAEFDRNMNRLLAIEKAKRNGTI